MTQVSALSAEANRSLAEKLLQERRDLAGGLTGQRQYVTSGKKSRTNFGRSSLVCRDHSRERPDCDRKSLHLQRALL
ncbi:hypothetical protein CSUI_008411 [Cystoisospora suis]|uniref:Uncharacterized protein n=1 Tax=Cystoisospora suis TaxID=483139 RepID=A0A2C6KN00_9APIC|nr:hypothetical protein CSUI_008411 [Cystoisospora suis]